MLFMNVSFKMFYGPLPTTAPLAHPLISAQWTRRRNNGVNLVNSLTVDLSTSNMQRD